MRVRNYELPRSDKGLLAYCHAKRFPILLVFLSIFAYLLSPFDLLGRVFGATHPIPDLIAKAQSVVAQRAAERPTDLKGSIEKYIALHKREPPEGYKSWYELAKVNQCNHDYSELYKSLEMWWTVPSSEIQRR